MEFLVALLFLSAGCVLACAASDRVLPRMPRVEAFLGRLLGEQEGPDIIINHPEGSIVGPLPDVHGADQVNRIIATLLDKDGEENDG